MSQISVPASAGPGGTVTSFSFNDDNGFAGTVTNPTTTPELTLETTVDDYETIYALNGALTGAGPGTAGQVYTSNGPSVAPTFEDAAAGGFSPAKIVVSPTAGEGDYTTIAAAVAGATSGDIIFIKEGTYSGETFTLDKDLSFVALTPGSSYGASLSPVVLDSPVISTNTQFANFEGIRFMATASQTFSNIYTGFFWSFCFRNCYIGLPNVSTTFFSSPDANDGGMVQFYDNIMWAGNGSTFLTQNVSSVILQGCSVPDPIVLNTGYQDLIISGPADVGNQISIDSCTLQLTLRLSNAFCQIGVRNSSIYSRTNPIFETPSTQINCYSSTLNAAADSIFSGGADGTLYQCNTFGVLADSGSTVTCSGINADGVAFFGSGSTPTGGMSVWKDYTRGPNPANPSQATIGYIQQATLDKTSAIPITNNTDTTVLTIFLDGNGPTEVSGVVMISGALTGTVATAGISTVGDDLSSTQLGFTAVQTSALSTATADQCLVIPPIWFTATAGNPFYLVVNIAFTVGTAVAYGSFQVKYL